MRAFLFHIYFSWQITDGRSRRWTNCNERFWLRQWKFVNSREQLRLWLQSKVNPLVVTRFLCLGRHRYMKRHSRHVWHFEISALFPRETQSCEAFHMGSKKKAKNWSCVIKNVINHGEWGTYLCAELLQRLVGAIGVSTFIWNMILHICVFPPWPNPWLL